MSGRRAARRPRWPLLAATALVLLAGLPAAAPPAAVGRLTADDYAQFVQDEAYWVSTAQLDCVGDGNGAIAEARITGTGTVSVHPYEANLGARAMLAAGPRYLPMVRRYLSWYLTHLNRPDTFGVTGTVYDHDYDPVTCVGRYQASPQTGAVPKYDSTDAYAGTFLTLVAEYARADPAGHDFLRSPEVGDALRVVAEVVGRTRGPSGLSSATPGYHAEYLLDNVEAQRGIEDYSWLLRTVLDDRPAADLRAAEAAAVREAIESVLWAGSRTPGMYGWAADRLEPTWDVWFPDSVAQLWPVWDLLGTAERRSGLWAEFVARRPGRAGSTPVYGSVAVDHDPNAAVAYAAARVGDLPALDDYLVRSQANWVATGRPAPWTVDDSGFRALAAQVGLSATSGRPRPAPGP